MHAFPGEYPKDLLKASQAGMLLWAYFDTEYATCRSFSDRITITNFALTRDTHADRLITWPRLQIHRFAASLDIDIPGARLFSRIITSQGTTATGAAIDVAIFFHNIVLPRWLSYLFPITHICFADIPGELNRK